MHYNIVILAYNYTLRGYIFVADSVGL